MSRRAAAPRRGREILLAGLYFSGVTVLMTWPQVSRLGDGMTDLWDAKLSAWILHWDFVQTGRDPWNLFQAPILHPAKYVLAFSENLYGEAVFGFPAFALGASRVAVYNLVFLLGMFSSALSAWALARYVTGDAVASVAAGWVYAFLPWRFAQSAHIHMQWGAFLCLIALFLLRYLDGGRRRDAVLCGASFAWNGIACIHYGFFAVFLVAVILSVERLQKGPQCNVRIRRAGVAVALGAAACVPFAIPYAHASNLYGMRRLTGELERFSGRWTDFLSAGFKNRLYGAVTARWERAEGVFFPGLLPLLLAAVPVVRLRRAAVRRAAEVEARREGVRVWIRGLDVLAILTALVWVAAIARPGLRIGGVGLQDPGRIQVILTAILLVRLGLEFPKAWRYRNLGDFVRHRRLEPRVILFLAIAAVGLLVALGAHTPYYRFLFKSAAAAFRAIRAPARGIVLFQLALGVLAAWGLSLLTRKASAKKRIGWAAAATVVLAFEYRCFPLPISRYDAAAPPVYRWLRGVEASGAVVEWPLGFPHDAEYTLRQADHRKPLVNGYSSYFPPSYGALWGMARTRPIPDSVWKAMTDQGASLLVYHSHETQGLTILESARAIRRGFDAGAIQLVGAFPHEGGSDFVFRFREAPRPASQLPAAGPGETRLFESAVQRLEDGMARFQPPFGSIHFPKEDQRVPPGFWGFGWALDDSGIASVRVGTELGEAGSAQIGGKWPGLSEVYPEYKDPGNGGYGFIVPDVPPGRHTLKITLVGRDGGETILERAIEVIAAEPSPTP